MYRRNVLINAVHSGVFGMWTYLWDLFLD